MEALHAALESAMYTGVEAECLRRLTRLVLNKKMYMFRGALTDEPAADAAPRHFVPKPDAAKE